MQLRNSILSLLLGALLALAFPSNSSAQITSYQQFTGSTSITTKTGTGSGTASGGGGTSVVILAAVATAKDDDFGAIQITQSSHGVINVGPLGAQLEIVSVLDGTLTVEATNATLDGAFVSATIDVVPAGLVSFQADSQVVTGSKAVKQVKRTVLCLSPGPHPVDIELGAHVQIGSNGSNVPVNTNTCDFLPAGLTVTFTELPLAKTYCTAGYSAQDCQGLITAIGCGSATASSGMVLNAQFLPGQRDGLFFFGTNGRQANGWGNGESFQCVVPPVFRTPIISGSGGLNTCDGFSTLDLNALWCPTGPKPGINPGAGATVQAQFWYRDPFNTSNQTTSLTDAVEFVVGI